jgi:hypothetical protein
MTRTNIDEITNDHLRLISRDERYTRDEIENEMTRCNDVVLRHTMIGSDISYFVARVRTLQRIIDEMDGGDK